MVRLGMMEDARMVIEAHPGTWLLGFNLDTGPTNAVRPSYGSPVVAWRMVGEGKGFGGSGLEPVVVDRRPAKIARDCVEILIYPPETPYGRYGLTSSGELLHDDEAADRFVKETAEHRALLARLDANADDAWRQWNRECHEREAAKATPSPASAPEGHAADPARRSEAGTAPRLLAGFPGAGDATSAAWFGGVGSQ